MADNGLDLAEWILRVRSATSVQDVFAVLEQFRKLPWSDTDCSSMSRAYMRVLDALGSGQMLDKSEVGQDAGAGGPVWYEKM